MDHATSQIGCTTSGKYCMATKMSDKNTPRVAPGCNSELCGMDEIYSKTSFIFWSSIPHMPHEV